MERPRTIVLKYLLIAGLMSTFIKCKKLGLCKDDNLHFERIDYMGNQLRVDGYYFGDTTVKSTPTLARIYYLYKNSIFFDGGVEPLEDAEISNFSIDLANEFPKKVKGAWGIFKIEGSTIEISRWQSSLHGCENAILEKGRILNDTTFILEPRGNVRPQESTFYFRPLSQKPDSTNNFIR